MLLAAAVLAEQLCVFFELIIHTILYIYHVYPKESFKRVRKFGGFIWVCRNPLVQNYIHELVVSLKEPVQRQVVSKIVILILNKLDGPTLAEERNQSDYVAERVAEFEDLWKTHRVGQQLLKHYNDAQRAPDCKVQHRAVWDESDFYHCFYAESALLVQSFHSIIQKLEQYQATSFRPVSTGSKINIPNDQSIANNVDETLRRTTFQVCVELWDPLNKEGASASASYKEATGWSGSLFTSETSGGHEDQKIALSREKLQLDWIPMYREVEVFFDISIDENDEIEQQDETKIIYTLRGGAPVIGIPILHVVITQQPD